MPSYLVLHGRDKINEQSQDTVDRSLCPWSSNGFLTVTVWNSAPHLWWLVAEYTKWTRTPISYLVMRVLPLYVIASEWHDEAGRRAQGKPLSGIRFDTPMFLTTETSVLPFLLYGPHTVLVSKCNGVLMYSA